MHQPARVAAPRDPPVQHICLHICLEEKGLIIVLNSCCSESASARRDDACNQEETFGGAFWFCFVFAGAVYQGRPLHETRWVKVTFHCQPRTLCLLIQT